MGKKYLDTSWDYRNADTKEFTHCFHNYPAMMIPQVARRLLQEYGINAKILFDPYCGSGTSLVEANIKGINSIGTDLNPLAQLIASAKTTIINLQTLDLYLKDFNDKIFNIRFRIDKLDSVVVPEFKNIDYWFTADVKKKLAYIKKYINNIKDSRVKQFFKIAFSETVRDSSLTRNGEFKLYRKSQKKLKNFDPDVFSLIEAKLSRNRDGLISFIDAKGNNNAETKIYSYNTVYGIDKDLLALNSIDLVITSPPYGDSRTTVAYGQFSRLANQWLGYSDASTLDNRLMGGKRSKDLHNFKYDLLKETIDRIQKEDNKRVQDVISFYRDYKSSIINISKVVKKEGFVCYVVGNRRVKGITLPTDEITKNMFESNGFIHIETIIRNIPRKRMPSKNSPTNEVGKTESTMNQEYIVVMQKNNISN